MFEKNFKIKFIQQHICGVSWLDFVTNIDLSKFKDKLLPFRNGNYYSNINLFNFKTLSQGMFFGWKTCKNIEISTARAKYR